MGCVFSSASLHCGKPGLYRVYNVDDHGREVSEGFIDIADAELILYQRDKEPIRWPLRCLRRYGYDAELFSFESGRRCPTGAGIYAFKCRRAESLFTNLQESILRSGQSESLRYNPPNSLMSPSVRNSAGHQNYIPLTTCMSPSANTFPQTSTVSPRHQYVNGDIETIPIMKTSLVVELPDHDYENAEVGANEHLSIEVQDPGVEQVPYENVAITNSLYCNVDMDGQNGTKFSRRASPQHNYLNADNIVPNGTVEGATGGVALGAVGGVSSGTSKSAGGINYHKLNYTQLELDRRCSGEFSMPSTSPTSPTILTSCPASPSSQLASSGDQYATIDFDATAALSYSARVSVDEGSRRTRHSSSVVCERFSLMEK